MKSKRIVYSFVAGMMAVTMVAPSATPVMAANTTELTKNSTSKTEFSKTVGSSFSVLLPKDITMTSDTENYIVQAKGNIAPTETLKVTVDSTIDMKREQDASYDDMDASMTLEDCVWDYKSLGSSYTEHTGTVNFAETKAGTYTGTGTFYIDIEKENIVENSFEWHAEDGYTEVQANESTTLYKISDKTISMDTIRNATGEMAMSNGMKVRIKADESTNTEIVDDSIAYIAESMICVENAGTYNLSLGEVTLSEGVYLKTNPSEQGFLSIEIYIGEKDSFKGMQQVYHVNEKSTPLETMDIDGKYNRYNDYVMTDWEYLNGVSCIELNGMTYEIPLKNLVGENESYFKHLHMLPYAFVVTQNLEEEGQILPNKGLWIADFTSELGLQKWSLTVYANLPKIDRAFDYNGNTTGKKVVKFKNNGEEFVKISDDTFTPEELTGYEMQVYYKDGTNDTVKLGSATKNDFMYLESLGTEPDDIYSILMATYVVLEETTVETGETISPGVYQLQSQYSSSVDKEWIYMSVHKIK